jgi:DNA-binding XRE family transcriptional regulator
MACTSLAVDRALKTLGASLQLARRRRNINAELMAERLGVTRWTVARMEKGEATVSMGVYAMAIYAFDPEKLDALSRLFENDPMGQIVADRALPRRIRRMPKT